MDRVTQAELVRRLRVFERAVNSQRTVCGFDGNTRPCPHHDPVDYKLIAVEYRLDYANNGVRVETLDESRIVSPRLTRRGLADWFDAALRALEEVTRG